ncbi:DivIVA domain-containing protein [Diaminobutyricimonas aerilata]|uniref:DivIVA domain-containing protein n=1 Tax=Diaminobutyricimonas aerilata TaxID=1162967 RepID=A0A2M9CIT7_9MICO|nr:DivIVA domain-containing protein [Diaminobutyricimonas aerilata]PJJ71790.1 DivIVA domain-containing protein [Diaminobutyricimonas aerilata]
MSTTFPRTRQLGYDVEQVEEFLEDARRAYTAPAGSEVTLTAESIRHTAFTMRKGGYSPSHVDAALERLEDAFAARERERVLQEAGDQQWFTQARATAQTILDRLDRPARHRFRRVSVFTTGYHPADVDRFTDRLVQYFQHGKPVSVDEVRTIAFRPRKGGYHETQVDLLLDRVTEVMLAVR